jgi:hypothetical protein
MRAIQVDAQRAGERDRLLLEAQRAHDARRPRADPAALVSRLARLLSRQADRLRQRGGRWSTDGKDSAVTTVTPDRT